MGPATQPTVGPSAKPILNSSYGVKEHGANSQCGQVRDAQVRDGQGAAGTDRPAPSRKGCCRARPSQPSRTSAPEPRMPALQAQNQICPLAEMDPSLRGGVQLPPLTGLLYQMSTHPVLVRNEGPEDPFLA